MFKLKYAISVGGKNMYCSKLKIGDLAKLNASLKKCCHKFDCYLKETLTHSAKVMAPISAALLFNNLKLITNVCGIRGITHLGIFLFRNRGKAKF